MATTADPQEGPSSHQMGKDARFAKQQPERDYKMSNSPLDKEEADTCRICRGEGTPDEPLFYPCKCSGSIKYVHQECLMEWLSHSQKKYCELCKTPFRFTKLYHPSMPSRIPTSVFVHRAAVHIARLWLTWCRAVLVASVWLVVLPLGMRVAWRSLFWVGDGGWAREVGFDNAHNTTYPSPASAIEPDAMSVPGTASLANFSFSFALPALTRSFSQALNTTASPIAFWTAIGNFFLGASRPPQNTSTPTHLTSTLAVNLIDSTHGRSPSLLSDIAFLQWFPSPAANRLLLDILEGQIITLFVVVSFILIFLIREWVVQQQPGMNIAALGEDAAVDREDEIVVEAAEEEVMDEEAGGEEDTLPDHSDTEEFPEHPRTSEQQALDPPQENVQDLPSSHDEEAPERQHQASQSSLSLRKRQNVLRAWRDSDEVPEDLKQAMFEGSSQEISDILGRIPYRESEKLKNAMVKLSQEATSDMEDEKSPTERELPYGELIEAMGPRQPGAKPTTDNASKPGSQFDVLREPSSSTLQRPVPTRDPSFIAEEIRHTMVEGSGWSFDNITHATQDGDDIDKPHHVPDSWDDNEASTLAQRNAEQTAEQEGSSNHSSESWEQISSVAEDKAEQASSTREKGKAKASHTDSHDTIYTEKGLVTDSDAGQEQDTLDMQETEERDPPNESGPSNEPAVQGSSQVVDSLHDNHQPVPIMDRLLNWIFDDIAPSQPAVAGEVPGEQIVQAVAEEVPVAPQNEDEVREPADPGIQDREVAAAAAEAGIDVNDQDAIDDAEDLEGIMELVGMQGPLIGLFQNAMFSAVLICATLASAVWLPYLWGKVVLIFLGSPVTMMIKFPLQVIATVADLVVDASLCVAASVLYWIARGFSTSTKVLNLSFTAKSIEFSTRYVSGPAHSIAINSLDRLKNLVFELTLPSSPNYARLSLKSHLALRSIQNSTSLTLTQANTAITSFCKDIATESILRTIIRILQAMPQLWTSATSALLGGASAFLSWVLTLKSLQVTFDYDPDEDLGSIDATAAQWTATDRFIAVLAGYAFFAVAGAVYLKRGNSITSSQQGQKIERIIADILRQAGGVIKVILIISIEMLVFPLYCGLLLDMALLPLFKDATLYTRWQFTRESPWTSGFVHWFLGTCYMFHFALFVSMCRKILRRGVLYFIRDPDDPTFHPVRDVLERSVTTQLRKIAFSGLVYGALVIYCLGGVVWGLSQVTTGVLPIKWVSYAPSLEFPLDLLFYNFLTPVIIKLYKPSDALHNASQWWFKLCARQLCLSNFLFGEKNTDEEGRMVDDQFVPSGRYVRAPASDQVRIPKGAPVFVDVDENNVRKTGQDEGGVHDSDLVSMVYIPPWFRVRIAAFVLSIWFFAAVMGMSVTITPLLFGRLLFSTFLPERIEMNDIHAFSLGLYSFGSVVYLAYQGYKVIHNMEQSLPTLLATFHSIAATTSRIGFGIVRFAYVWTGLVMLIPFLFAMLLELYLLMPLHAYLGPTEPHVVHIIQDWTLGFLYSRLAARAIFADQNSRPARAFSAVIQDGYLQPNARVATKCFLLPMLALFAIAIAAPSALALSINKTIYLGASQAVKSLVWRYAYPTVGLFVMAAFSTREGLRIGRRWRMVVRDEVYLVGERLHNFGESKPGASQGKAGGN